MRLRALLAAAVLALPLAAHAADPAPVVKAERAFAGDAAQRSWVLAFKAFAASDGLMFAPGPVNAQRHLAEQDAAMPRAKLAWWPLWAGMSASGDLGFTTGPFTIGGRLGGQYFTVWKRQSDGTWKWVLDGGPDVAFSAAPPDGTPPGVLAPASGKRVGRTAALAQVKAAEARLAAQASSNAPAAYRAVLAPDARIAGATGKLASGEAQIAGELTARPQRLELAPLGLDAGRAGDLAWTYGKVGWTQMGEHRDGHYVRIWRHDRAGWRLVWDQFMPLSPDPVG